MTIPYFQFIAQKVDQVALDVSAIKAKQAQQDAALAQIAAGQAAMMAAVAAAAQAIQDTQQVALQTRELMYVPEGQ